MKSVQNLPEDLSDAMNHFVKKLPDPDRSYNSTIKDEISVAEKRVIFMAQKKKGAKGMCWDIRYKVSRAKHVAE